MFKEFRKFILRGNVVDLAVGVIIGAAFNSVVQSLVTMITDLFPNSHGKFASAHFDLFGKSIVYGNFINAVVSFLLVATIVFFLVVQPINKLAEIAIGSRDTDEDTTKKCPLCLSVIPRQASRCKYCTANLKTKA